MDLLLDDDERGAVAIDLAQPLVDGVHHNRSQAEGELVGHETLDGTTRTFASESRRCWPPGQGAAHLPPPLPEDGKGRVGASRFSFSLPRPSRWRKARVRFSSTVRLEKTPRPRRRGHAEPGDLVGREGGDVLPART